MYKYLNVYLSIVRVLSRLLKNPLLMSGLPANCESKVVFIIIIIPVVRALHTVIRRLTG